MTDEGTDDRTGRDARVRELLGVVSDRLSSHWTKSASELLESGEANEAILQIAWGIAEERVVVTESWLGFIETTAGDPLDLPDDLTGSTRPVRSRRADERQ